MPLPIIILFSRYWDIEISETLIHVLSNLAKIGYDTLCIDAPYNVTPHELIDNLENSIVKSQNYAKLLENKLKELNIPVNKPLAQFSAKQLAQWIALYIDKKNACMITDKIKFLPALILSKNILLAAQMNSFLIKGMDINLKEFKKIINTPFPYRQELLIEKEKSRMDTMAENLMSLFGQRKGIILTWGAYNAPQLITLLKEQNFDDQFTYFLLHTEQLYEQSNFNDIKLLKNMELDESQFILIDKNNSPENCAQLILTAIAQKKPKKYICEIKSGCSHTDILEKILQTKVKAWLRAQHYVDAVIKINEKEAHIIAKLNDHKLKFHYSLFKDQNCIVIPNINTDKVATKIRKNMK